MLAALHEIVKEDQNRTGYVNRRIGADDNAAHQREREPVQYLTAEQKQRQGGQQREARRQNGSAQGLVHTQVDDRFQLFTAKKLEVLADAVERDDGVVHRIADQGQQGGNHGERNLFVEERKQADGDDSVVEHRHHRRCAIDPFEAERDVNQHPTEGVKNRQDRFVLEFRPNSGANLIYADNRQRVKIKLLLEYVQDLRGYSWYRSEIVEAVNQAGVLRPVANDIGCEVIDLLVIHGHAGVLERGAKLIGQCVGATSIHVVLAVGRLPKIRSEGADDVLPRGFQRPILAHINPDDVLLLALNFLYVGVQAFSVEHCAY